jgi:cardiolipin hydrolase
VSAHPTAADMEALVALLDTSLDDMRLSDDEKRSLAIALRHAEPPEEGLRFLRNQAFALAHQRTRDGFDAPSVLRWLEGVMRALDVARTPAVGLRTEVCFSPGQDCLRAIQARLRDARQRADLCVFTLSDDRIAHEVIAAHARGVNLRFVTDNDKEFDAGSDVARLRTAGVPIRVDRTDAHMHHKFALFDGLWLLNGSYNWTRSACDHNEENLVVTNQPQLVRQFQQQFDMLWDELGE